MCWIRGSTQWKIGFIRRCPLHCFNGRIWIIEYLYFSLLSICNVCCMSFLHTWFNFPLHADFSCAKLQLGLYNGQDQTDEPSQNKNEEEEILHQICSDSRGDCGPNSLPLLHIPSRPWQEPGLYARLLLAVHQERHGLREAGGEHRPGGARQQPLQGGGGQGRPQHQNTHRGFLRSEELSGPGNHTVSRQTDREYPEVSFSRKTWGRKFLEYPGVKLVFMLGRDPDSAVHVMKCSEELRTLNVSLLCRNLSPLRQRIITTSSWRISTTPISISLWRRPFFSNGWLPVVPKPSLYSKSMTTCLWTLRNSGPPWSRRTSSQWWSTFQTTTTRWSPQT